MDSLELLGWVLPAASEDVSHPARILSDGLRHSVNSAKLRRNVAIFAVDLDDEKGLLHIRYLHVIGLHEVLSNAHLLAIMSLEAHVDRVLLEVDILHEVGLLVAVGTNHSLELELVQDLANFVAHLGVLHDFIDPLKTSFVGDELVDVIDHDGQTRGVVVG